MSEETKYCTYCGSENTAQAKFCSNCGASLQNTEEINIDYGPAIETYESDVQYETHNSSDAYTPEYYGESFMEDAEQEMGGYLGISIAAMVCGIISIVCCCLWLFSIVLAIAAVSLGIISLYKKYDGKGIAIAGIVTGGVGFVLSVFWLIIMGLNTVTNTLFF